MLVELFAVGPCDPAVIGVACVNVTAPFVVVAET